MKTLLLIGILLNFSKTFGQIIYDKDVYNQYTKLYNKLPRQEHGDSGLAIFVEFKCDTLNRVDPKDENLKEITLIDVNTGSAIESEQKVEKYPTLTCFGTIWNDTLGIQVSDLFLNQAIMHFITKDSISIFYGEHHGNDSNLKQNSGDSLTTSVTVSTDILLLTLNDSTYKVGDTIYGSAELITNSYFLKDTWEENHFYELRWKFKYYFKCKLTKNGT